MFMGDVAHELKHAHQYYMGENRIPVVCNLSNMLLKTFQAKYTINRLEKTIISFVLRYKKA
jgi:hypothetical protein